MTRIYRSSGTLAATTVISLGLLAATFVVPAIAQTSPHLSKQDLNHWPLRLVDTNVSLLTIGIRRSS